MTIRDAVVVALVLPPFGFPQLPCPSEGQRVSNELLRCAAWNREVLVMAGVGKPDADKTTSGWQNAGWAWRLAGDVNDPTLPYNERQVALDALVDLIGRDAVMRGELP